MPAIEEAKMYYPEKKMNFLKRWFLKKIRSGMNELNKDMIEEVSVTSLVTTSVTRLELTERSFRFNIHFANGGRIVETVRHDRKLDRTNTSLYIVTNDQDFGKEIDKIITMESLKN
jgi:hypothetical protein